jgi:succinate dehydrogenase/fumarate reductase flavoprotein subunit
VNLTQSVQTYNDAIQNGKEDPFRGENVFERPFAEEGPYYGVEVVSAVHMTLGGVVADENGQVLNNANEPVEGLYAAGEVTDVSGAFNAAILFGRISGQKAGEYVLAQ